MKSEKTNNFFELSVVIPCLNEKDTLKTCLNKAFSAISKLGISAEIIVADNGSTDGSQDIAQNAGARVISIEEKGYGSALMGGIKESRGRYIIMGDADDSYDFQEIPKFVTQLQSGFDLVQGCRLPAGRGTVLPGAMPVLHRLWGNPMFTYLARRWFRAPIHDVYCGMRGFTRELYDKLDLRCVGMEFATEMIIKSSLYREHYGIRIGEVPIVLHPDGRKSHPPHLRTFRDGWRTLRFFMLYSPRWLYVLPGLLFGLLGLFLAILVFADFKLKGIDFEAHTLLFSGLFLTLGYQSILFGAFAKVFAIGEHLIPLNARTQILFKIFTLERGLFVGIISFILGVILMSNTVITWWTSDFGPMNYEQTLLWLIPGIVFATVGVQTILSSFFLSILGMRRK
jgi:glycosyltransferase involved in cell wall biosynthesis